MTKLSLLIGTILFGASVALAVPKPMPHAACGKKITAKLPEKKFVGFWWENEKSTNKGDQSFKKTDFKNGLHFHYKTSGQTAQLEVTNYKTGKLNSYSWDAAKNCAEKTSTTSIEKRAPANTNTFHDEDLRKLIQDTPWGVVYVWTPYMPLSFMGMAEIKKAVAERKGQLTIVLDPTASPEDIRPVIERLNLTEAETKLLISDELRARGFGLHYPAAIVYHDGMLSESAYFGHKTAEAYGRWIDAELLKFPKGKK